MLHIQAFRGVLAESEGFEPPEQLPVHRISSAARSTTPATFHCIGRVEIERWQLECRMKGKKPGGDVMKLRDDKI